MFTAIMKLLNLKRDYVTFFPKEASKGNTVYEMMSYSMLTYPTPPTADW